MRLLFGILYQPGPGCALVQQPMRAISDLLDADDTMNDSRTMNRDPFEKRRRDETVHASLKQARLDLLPVLNELLRVGSVTKAAHSLNITQSAVSQKLRALRGIFNDDLLVPVGRTLKPTELALSLAEPLARLLEDAEHLLGPRASFDPLNEKLHVTIATADYVSLLLAPHLVTLCAQEAPHVTFEFIEGSSTMSIDDLSRIDFFIAPRAYVDSFGKRMGALALWKDRMVCIGSIKNKALPERFTPEALQKFHQVVYRFSPNIPDRIRRLIHPTYPLESSVVCSAPNFSVLVATVDRSDCIAIVPRRLANEMALHRRLKVVELVGASADFEMSAHWGPSSSNKRGHSWAKQLLLRAARSVC